MPDIAAQVAELQASNGERLARLNHHKMTINTTTLLLRHLIEVFFPTEEDREVMNLGFQEKLAEALDDAEAQIDRVNLERSAAQASGLIIPGSPV